MAGERWAGWIPSPLPAGHGRARTRGGFRRRPERMQGGDGEVSRRRTRGRKSGVYSEVQQLHDHECMKRPVKKQDSQVH
uniref:Uncharacterized protein n=1 Tax=Oryza nivara TaxID=4536 RepID=A0A0E0I2Q8_ORYNI